MREEDREKLVDLVSDTMKYYRQPVTPFLLGVWMGACAPFDYEQVKRAVESHAADPERGRFEPRVSDIVRVLAGTATDRAAVAWGKVMDACSRVGAWQSVAFDDPVIHAVLIDMGGWPKICRWPTAELSYAQHRFTEHYRSLSERGCEGYPRVLPGEHSADEEFTRVGRGLEPPEPVLVGHVDQCLAVIRGGGDSRSVITFLPKGVKVSEMLRLGSGLAVKALEAPHGE